MNLVKVNQTENGMSVDGRELHEFLEVGSRFNDWIRNRIDKYGFAENEDYRAVTKKLVSGGQQTDYELSIDMAKELCMVENNEKGREARKYFIECEKRLKQSAIQPMTTAEVIAAIANQAVEQEKRLALMETRVSEQAEVVTAMQDTFMKRDEDWRSSINRMMSAAAYRSDGNYQEMRTRSYQMLEERGRCDLNTRLRNLKDRLDASGSTRTKINSTTKMDVIEADPRLKEIYTTIVKELSIGSMKGA